jgi:DNA repair ATPase RecN
MEERVLYPAVDEDFPDLRDELREHLHEHEELQSTLEELADMSPDDDEFDQTIEDLRALVTHHVEEEESELFPTLRERWDAGRLERVGRALEHVREEARAVTH